MVSSILLYTYGHDEYGDIIIYADLYIFVRWDLSSAKPVEIIYIRIEWQMQFDTSSAKHPKCNHYKKYPWSQKT